jgi:hypothetical protein
MKQAIDLVFSTILYIMMLLIQNNDDIYGINPLVGTDISSAFGSLINTLFVVGCEGSSSSIIYSSSGGILDESDPEEGREQ